MGVPENEVKVWGFVIGNLPMRRKPLRELSRLFGTLPGFLGVNPVYPNGTVMLFETENDAKVARNMLLDQITPVGKEISECYVDKRYVRRKRGVLTY